MDPFSKIQDSPKFSARKRIIHDVPALQDTDVEALKSRCTNVIKSPWGIGGEEAPRRATAE